MDKPLSPESWARLKGAFEQALDLAESQRLPWLTAELADEPQLLSAAERMLSEVDTAGSRTERVASKTRGGAASAGDWVGSQRLVRRIGMGGMGEVWEGERVIGGDAQQVAVKMLAFGGGGAFAQRLDAERRVLTRLNHPNICTLVDGGVDVGGRPYLVLEYVQGQSLTHWCYEQQVSLDARVRLMLEVCDAVAYAHAHLVVHRDLKPANVLVGASGRVKLLDFGIAKMLDQDTDEHSGATRMLTPTYASPEQARGLPVSTATDIYALGVLTYELICERVPYQLEGLANDELIERLLKPNHASPSQMLIKHGQRRSARRVAEGLDAIVAKAMHPDMTRRYKSVESFAEDLRRWLQGRPVQARPDHWLYRLRCLVRRNALASAAVLALIVVGSGFSVALWQRYQAERAALVVAERERALSNQVSDFLVELFSSADPDSTQADRVDLKTLLGRGTDALVNGGIDDPDVAAGLSARIAQVYASLGLYAEADSLLDQFEPSTQVLKSPLRRAELAEARARTRFGAGDSAAAVELLRRALLLRERDSDPARARTLYQLAVVLRDRAEYAEAAELLVAAAAIQQSHDPTALIRTHVQQAALAWLEGDFDRAHSRYLDALAEGEKHLSPQHPDLARALSGLSLLAHRRSDYQSAIEYGERALAIHGQAFGLEHPVYAQTLANLGALYMDAGQAALARQRLQAALQIQQPRSAELGPALSNTLNNLGLLDYRAGDASSARVWFEQAAQSATDAYGAEHPQVASIVDNLGLCWEQMGDLMQAHSHYQRALQVRQKVLSSAHPHLAYSHHHLGQLALDSGDLQQAEPHLSTARRIRSEALGPQHPLTASSHAAWAQLRWRQGAHPEAENGYTEALSAWSLAEGEHAAEMASALTSLAELKAERGKANDAELTRAQALAESLSPAQRAELAERWARLTNP